MVKVWKIGSWPGLWGNNTKKHKDKFISEYALPKGFVALGYGWIDDITTLTDDEIKKCLKRRGKINWRTKQITDFARVINRDDIILLYNSGVVYVGRVEKIKPYYHVNKKDPKNNFIVGVNGEDIAPHRIPVTWLFNQNSFDADFKKWQDTVHEFSLMDLNRIKDDGLRAFLKSELSK